MEREKATMRRSMLVAQQQLTTAQSEAADVRGANSKALAKAEDAVLQLQRRLTEQVRSFSAARYVSRVVRFQICCIREGTLWLPVLPLYTLWQASTLAVGALELDELRESATKAAQREEADGRMIAQLKAENTQL